MLSEQQAISIKSTAKTYGDIFKKEAEDNGTETKLWLACFIISAIVSIGITIGLMFMGNSEKLTSGVLSFILNFDNLGKLFIFSILFFYYYSF